MATNTLGSRQPFDTYRKWASGPNESVYLAALAAPCQCQLGDISWPSRSAERKVTAESVQPVHQSLQKSKKDA